MRMRRPAIRLDSAGDEGRAEGANGGAVTRAAGLMLVCRGGETGAEQVLFVRHGERGTWEFPGGGLERGETAEGAVLREVREEIGARAFGRISLLMRSTLGGVDYSTFIAHVAEEFEPELADGELIDWQWASPDAPPEPLHAGVRMALGRLGMNETDLARAIAAGDAPSPQQYENIWLFAIRITGTGASYRPELREHVWRDPSLYLNSEFLARCNGLPVIIQHPEGEALDSEEFSDRVIGSVVLPYLEGDEVWGVARIYDQKAAHVMRTVQLSTSPAVIFRDGSVNETRKLASGKTLLIEGEPSLLDHVAICEAGVWDLGGPPTGVAIGDPVMASGVDSDLPAEARADSVKRYEWSSAVEKALS